MSERTWKLMELVTESSAFLKEKQIENPRRNAEELLAKALGIKRIDLYLQYDRPLDSTEVETFRNYIRRRLRHEPLQLILGSVDFLNAVIRVRRGLLIPRQETEELASQLVKRMAGMPGERIKVLDIGTGTGCLAVAIAKSDSRVYADAVDIDGEAVECAVENAERNGVADRIRAFQTDALKDDFRLAVSPPYDVIVTNPPYVAERDFETLAPEIRLFEKKTTLTAGEDGLAFYRRLAELLPVLSKSGTLTAMEIGLDQSDAVRDLMSPVLDNIEIVTDSNGIPRMLFGTSGSPERGE